MKRLPRAFTDHSRSPPERIVSHIPASKPSVSRAARAVADPARPRRTIVEERPRPVKRRSGGGKSAPRANPPEPMIYVILAIVFAVVPALRPPGVEPHVGPARRQLARLKRTRGRVADHERRTVLAERPVDLGHEPARMPELEAVPARRKPLERGGEALVVAMEALRQLPEHRSELGRARERLDRRVVALDALVQVAKTLDVREVSARLDREQELGPRLLEPACDRLGAREPIERRVHLDRVEQSRVVLEPTAGRQPIRIDGLAPVLVVPTRAANPNGSQLRSAVASSVHWSGVPAATRRERASTSSGAAPNGGVSKRSIARPHSRTSSCPAAMSTERAPFSEQTPSTRPAARWQSESASEPMIRILWAIPTKAAALSATYDVRVASNERISIRSFGRSLPSRRPSSHAPPPRSAHHSSREPKS